MAGGDRRREVEEEVKKESRGRIGLILIKAKKMKARINQ